MTTPHPRLQRFAAIDIGSNAIRMMIAEAVVPSQILSSPTHQQVRFTPIKKYRFPIRLGADVFKSGRISQKNLKQAARTFEKFSAVTRKFGVQYYRAVGTSALREASNGHAFVELIRRKSGIRIEVIDGILEAELIYSAVRNEVNLEQARALLIDVGGGSVEVTFTHQGRIEATQSFPFGTVRTLEMLKKRNLKEAQLNLVIGDFIKPLSQFILAHSPGHKMDFAIGTGGNLESLGKIKPLLLGKSSKTEMNDLELEAIIQQLRKFTNKERIQKLDMRPDRADVIVPAAMVVQAILRQASTHRLVVPAVGLKDGLLLSLWQKAVTAHKPEAKRPT